MSITGKFIVWIKIYLENCKQRVVINVQESSWTDVNAGVPQGSISVPYYSCFYQ